MDARPTKRQLFDELQWRWKEELLRSIFGEPPLVEVTVEVPTHILVQLKNGNLQSRGTEGNTVREGG
jgi:hypothetical protein